MKAFTLLFSATVLMASLTFAGNGESTLDKLINRKIHYPESLRAKQIDTRVNVLLSVNDSGSIEIISIESDSNELIEAVKQQVSQLKIKDTSDLIGKQFKYTFHFKIQE